MEILTINKTNFLSALSIGIMVSMMTLTGLAQAKANDDQRPGKPTVKTGENFKGKNCAKRRSDGSVHFGKCQNVCKGRPTKRGGTWGGTHNCKEATKRTNFRPRLNYNRNTSNTRVR